MDEEVTEMVMDEAEDENEVDDNTIDIYSL